MAVAAYSSSPLTTLQTLTAVKLIYQLETIQNIAEDSDFGAQDRRWCVAGWGCLNGKDFVVKGVLAPTHSHVPLLSLATPITSHACTHTSQPMLLNTTAYTYILYKPWSRLRMCV